MQYYVSLPHGWTAGRKWPVVVVIESANRQFLETLGIFAKARGDKPFILVAPMVTTNGGANYRQAGTYHYSDAVWNRIEQDRCRFDTDGVAAVVADIRKLFGGEDAYFLTGWEAGGHTVWPLIFQHPETIRAAAPAVTNYAGDAEPGWTGGCTRGISGHHLSGCIGPTRRRAGLSMQSQQARKLPKITATGTCPNASSRASRTVRWQPMYWRTLRQYGRGAGGSDSGLRTIGPARPVS
jgi:hypothetical protein